MRKLNWWQNPAKELRLKDHAVIYPDQWWRVCCCLLPLEWGVADFVWERAFLTTVVQLPGQFVPSEKVCSSPPKLMCLYLEGRDFFVWEAKQVASHSHLAMVAEVAGGLKTVVVVAVPAPALLPELVEPMKPIRLWEGV